MLSREGSGVFEHMVIPRAKTPMTHKDARRRNRFSVRRPQLTSGDQRKTGPQPRGGASDSLPALRTGCRTAHGTDWSIDVTTDRDGAAAPLTFRF